jgi:hypothetical protein
VHYDVNRHLEKEIDPMPKRIKIRFEPEVNLRIDVWQVTRKYLTLYRPSLPEFEPNAIPQAKKAQQNTASRI